MVHYSQYLSIISMQDLVVGVIHKRAPIDDRVLKILLDSGITRDVD